MDISKNVVFRTTGMVYLLVDVACKDFLDGLKTIRRKIKRILDDW
jgi:hypothetical protein